MYKEEVVPLTFLKSEEELKAIKTEWLNNPLYIRRNQEVTIGMLVTRFFKTYGWEYLDEMNLNGQNPTNNNYYITIDGTIRKSYKESKVGYGVWDPILDRNMTRELLPEIQRGGKRRADSFEAVKTEFQSAYNKIKHDQMRQLLTKWKP